MCQGPTTEADYLKHCEEVKQPLGLVLFLVFKARSLYIHGLFEEALVELEKVDAMPGSQEMLSAFFTRVDFNFIMSLTLLALMSKFQVSFA